MNLCRSQDKVMRIIIMINIISYKKILKENYENLSLQLFLLR